MANLSKHLPILAKIFHDKNWIPLFESLGQEDIFDKFLELIKEVSDKEADLLLSLTEDYLYVDANSMTSRLRSIYHAINDHIISNFKEVYFLPLRSPEMEFKTKSPSSVLYPAFHLFKWMNSKIPGMKIESYESMEVLTGDLINRNRNKLIFVDDFIGSGNTALKSLEYYNNVCKQAKDDISILCLVCQREGHEILRQKGYEIFVHEVRTKGVSDSSKFKNISEAIEIMTNISERVVKNRNLYLGYNSSEALITMPFRTPNNTFPVYWANNGERMAPFYR